FSRLTHLVFTVRPPPPRSTLFPYTTLFRSPSWRRPCWICMPSDRGCRNCSCGNAKIPVASFADCSEARSKSSRKSGADVREHGQAVGHARGCYLRFNNFRKKPNCSLFLARRTTSQRLLQESPETAGPLCRLRGLAGSGLARAALVRRSGIPATWLAGRRGSLIEAHAQADALALL